MTQPPKTEMILQMEVTDIFSHLMFPVFSISFAFGCSWCHYWKYKAIAGPYRGCTTPPTPPGDAIAKRFVVGIKMNSLDPISDTTLVQCPGFLLVHDNAQALEGETPGNLSSH